MMQLRSTDLYFLHSYRHKIIHLSYLLMFIDHKVHSLIMNFLNDSLLLRANLLLANGIWDSKFPVSDIECNIIASVFAVMSSSFSLFNNKQVVPGTQILAKECNKSDRNLA